MKKFKRFQAVSVLWPNLTTVGFVLSSSKDECKIAYVTYIGFSACLMVTNVSGENKKYRNEPKLSDVFEVKDSVLREYRLSFLECLHTYISYFLDNIKSACYENFSNADSENIKLLVDCLSKSNLFKGKKCRKSKSTI